MQEDGRLLLIQRSRSVRVPLAWCFPGGTMETGETQEATLTREMREELSLTVRPDRHLLTQTKHDGRLILYCWSATIIDGPPVANPREVADLAWLTPEEIRVKDGILPGTTAILDAVAS